DRVEGRDHALVQALRAGEFRLDLDPADEAIRLAAPVDVAALHVGTVALHGERGGNAGIGTEVHREPAVVVGRLPVARSPGVIAEAEAVDPVLGAVDRERAGRAAMLLEVPARELLPVPFAPDAHPLPVALLARLAAEAGRETFVAERERRRDVRVRREGAARVEEIERPRQETARAVVADPVLAERRT